MTRSDDEFEPDERQRRLAEDARCSLEMNRREGMFISAELGRRMQDEAAVEAGAVGHDTFLEFYVRLGAEIDETLPRDELLQRLGDGFINAAIYRRSRYLLAVECSVSATSVVGARIEVERRIQQAFPDARSVDMDGYPASLIASLNALSDGGVLNEEEFNHEMSTLHQLQVEARPGQQFDPLDDANATLETFCIEATVFEVLTHVDHVHLRAEDERIFVLTPSTPVLRGTQRFSEGQRYRLLVAKRLNAVVRAELIPQEP